MNAPRLHVEDDKASIEPGYDDGAVDVLVPTVPTVDSPTSDIPSVDVSPVAPAELDGDPLAALRGLIDESARGPDIDDVPPAPTPVPEVAGSELRSSVRAWPGSMEHEPWT